MALRITLSKRVFHRATTPPLLSPATPTTAAVAAALVQVQPHRESFTAPPFFRRYLQRSATNHHSAATPLSSTFLGLPIGEKLRENLKSLGSTGDHRDGVSSPLGCSPASAVVEGGFGVSAADAKRLLRLMQVCKVRERIRNIPASTVQYGEFVPMCGDVCGDDEVGSELAKALDESGNVIVLGVVVFLHPDQKVDLSKLEMAALWRYLMHFNLVIHDVVQRHFCVTAIGRAASDHRVRAGCKETEDSLQMIVERLLASRSRWFSNSNKL